MTWAQRLNRVFKIDIAICEHCGGAVQVISYIEDLVAVKRVSDRLAHRPESILRLRKRNGRAPEIFLKSRGTTPAYYYLSTSYVSCMLLIYML